MSGNDNIWHSENIVCPENHKKVGNECKLCIDTPYRSNRWISVEEGEWG